MAVCSTRRRASGPRMGIPGGFHAPTLDDRDETLALVLSRESKAGGRIGGMRGNGLSDSN